MIGQGSAKSSSAPTIRFRGTRCRSITSYQSGLSDDDRIAERFGLLTGVNAPSSNVGPAVPLNLLEPIHEICLGLPAEQLTYPIVLSSHRAATRSLALRAAGLVVPPHRRDAFPRRIVLLAAILCLNFSSKGNSHAETKHTDDKPMT